MEYPKMLYHLTEGERIVEDFDEEQALGDAWMSLAALREAQAAPAPKAARRRRPSEEPDDGEEHEDDA